MKKITYLVAPLMVLPFLVGCNKTTTYNVSVVEASDPHLEFKSEDGKKDLKDVKAEKGKDFVFIVQALQENVDVYRVVKDFVYVSVGGNVLYDGVAIKYGGTDEDNHSYATVTVAKDKVIGDIAVGGIAGKEGYYFYYIPYTLGIEVESVDPNPGTGYLNYGYAKCEQDLKITFTDDIKGAGSYADGGEWAFFPKGENPKTITVKAKTVNDSITIVARGGEDHWLDLFEWSEIKEISEMGAAQYLFVAGDTKQIKINGHEHEVEIIGFNHDTLVTPIGEQTKAGITFRFTTLISNEEGNAITTVWDTTSERNFVESTYNKYLNDADGGILAMLPEDLKTVIKPVTKKVGVYNSGWSATEYYPTLFPLSVSEYNKNGDYDVSEEGDAYELFNEEFDDKQNALADANGNKHNYWLRSPSTDEGPFWPLDYYQAYLMQSTPSDYEGLADVQDVDIARSIAPAFCI